jgi:hypothetical protein
MKSMFTLFSGVRPPIRIGSDTPGPRAQPGIAVPRFFLGGPSADQNRLRYDGLHPPAPGVPSDTVFPMTPRSARRSRSLAYSKQIRSQRQRPLMRRFDFNGDGCLF